MAREQPPIDCFNRRAGMASIIIDSMAADPLGHGIRIPYLPVAEARALFVVLSRRAAGSRAAAPMLTATAVPA